MLLPLLTTLLLRQVIALQTSTPCTSPLLVLCCTPRCSTGVSCAVTTHTHSTHSQQTLTVTGECECLLLHMVHAQLGLLQSQTQAAPAAISAMCPQIAALSQTLS